MSRKYVTRASRSNTGTTRRSSSVSRGSIEGSGWESTVAAVFESATIRKVSSQDDENSTSSSNVLPSPEVRVRRLRRLLQGSVVVVGDTDFESKDAAADIDK